MQDATSSNASGGGRSLIIDSPCFACSLGSVLLKEISLFLKSQVAEILEFASLS